MAQTATPMGQRGRYRQVVHQLGLRVLRDELRPGDTLPDEAALSAQFGVSRTVLREAMRVLAAKGLVEARPRVGTRVRPRRDWSLLDPDVLAWRSEAGPDERFFREVTEVRGVIEPAAAALAATRATGAERDAIAAWCRRMETAAQADDAEGYADADMAFHAAILGACHNDLLAQLSDAIGVALRWSRRLTTSIPGSSVAAMAEHRAVAEAIGTGAPRAAEDAMRALLRRTAADIDRALRGLGEGQPA